MSHDSHLIESEIDSETVFSGALLEVRKDRVRLPNGKESLREYIVHPGAVVILAFPRQRPAAVRTPVPLSLAPGVP